VLDLDVLGLRLLFAETDADGEHAVRVFGADVVLRAAARFEAGNGASVGKRWRRSWRRRPSR
jgi:hypothetical protein